MNNIDLDFENRIETIWESINKDRLYHFTEITHDKTLKKKKLKVSPVDYDKINETSKVFADLEFKNKIVKKKSLLVTKRQNNTTLDELEEYLNKKSEKIYNRPWNKLEPKYKIDRFSNYVNSQSEWSDDDKKDALHFLESCL